MQKGVGGARFRRRAEGGRIDEPEPESSRRHDGDDPARLWPPRAGLPRACEDGAGLMDLHPRCIPVKGDSRRREPSTNAGHVVNRRGIASRGQFSGGGGRRFESSHSDHSHLSERIPLPRRRRRRAAEPMVALAGGLGLRSEPAVLQQILDVFIYMTR